MWLTFLVVPYITKHTIPLHFPLALNYRLFTSRSRWLEKIRLGNIWDFKKGQKFYFLIVWVTTPCWNIACRFWRNVLFFSFFYGASTCFRSMACCWRDFKTIQILKSVHEALHSTLNREGYCKFLCPALPSKSVRHLWPYNRLGCRLHRLQILSFKLLHSVAQEFPKVYSADPIWSASSSHRIRGCISVIATLKFTYFLNNKNDVFKSNRATYSIGEKFISYDLQDTHLNQKTHVLTKRAAVNALLRMPIVCIHGYLKSVLWHKFLIFDACRSDALYLREQGCEDFFLRSWDRASLMYSSKTNKMQIPDAVYTVFSTWWWAEEPPETCR